MNGERKGRGTHVRIKTVRRSVVIPSCDTVTGERGVRKVVGMSGATLTMPTPPLEGKLKRSYLLLALKLKLF